MLLEKKVSDTMVIEMINRENLRRSNG